MRSRSVNHRKKSSESVQAAGVTHKEVIEASFQAGFGVDPDGPYTPRIIDAAIRSLVRNTLAMEFADDQLDRQRRELEVVRAVHAGLAQSVRRTLVSLRQVAEATLGPDYVRQLGFSGNTPVVPIELERLGKRVLEKLADTPPDARALGVTFDAEPWRVQLAGPVAALADARSAYTREERAAEACVVTRQRSLQTFDEAFSRTATLFSTLLELAGETELAGRVRPASRRRGQTAEHAGEHAPESAETPAPAPSVPADLSIAA